ncbi:uncharacterized protein LOC144335222 isoform X2 [Macaca mulatta]
MAQHIHHQACRGDIGTLCITSHVPGKEVREMHLPAFSAAALQSKAPDLPSFLPASAAFQESDPIYSSSTFQTPNNSTKQQQEVQGLTVLPRLSLLGLWRSATYGCLYREEPGIQDHPLLWPGLQCRWLLTTSFTAFPSGHGWPPTEHPPGCPGHCNPTW